MGFDLYYGSVGGDLANVSFAYQRTIYEPTIDNFIIGQISSGGTISIKAVAFDEAGNRSVDSNTITFTGG